MGRLPVAEPSANTLHQRKSRERKRSQQLGLSTDDLSGIDSDQRSDAPGAYDLLPAGIVSSPSLQPGEVSDYNLEEEQALWVRRRREITELELARRRGSLISLVEAKAERTAAGRRIRAALDRIPQHLPAHLSPDLRTTCETAIRTAVTTALASL